ncbi:unnamed protein product [Peronospora belbahrii]|uniref:Uncharacterized protein n=1 Tax=Peronospora belbahrii TaxID=622444 RepID=A0ABN8CRS3_9STRA|nr:unnamed protein product [Peronospora belbahrii]
MDVLWDRLQAFNPHKDWTIMSEDAGMLWQPLMANKNSEENSKDEELGLLPPQEIMRTQFDESVTTRRKRRRRKEDEDLGEVTSGFSLDKKPLKVLQSMGKWIMSLSTVGTLVSSPTSSFSTSLSTQMLSERDNIENMDEVSHRALTLLAMVTLGFCCLLLLMV